MTDSEMLPALPQVAATRRAMSSPKTVGVLASVSGKVIEALTTLDNFNMAQWTGSGFNADPDCLLTALPLHHQRSPVALLPPL
jgi:hypothetical protein